MRKIFSELGDLLVGNKLLNTIKRENPFFNNCCASHYLDLQRIYGFISMISQTATSISLVYLFSQRQDSGILPFGLVLPLVIKGVVYKTSREIIDGIRDYKKVLLERIIEENKTSRDDIRGEEWKIGTGYDFSDDS